MFITSIFFVPAYAWHYFIDGHRQCQVETKLGSLRFTSRPMFIGASTCRVQSPVEGEPLFLLTPKRGRTEELNGFATYETTISQECAFTVFLADWKVPGRELISIIHCCRFKFSNVSFTSQFTPASFCHFSYPFPASFSSLKCKYQSKNIGIKIMINQRGKKI